MAIHITTVNLSENVTVVSELRFATQPSRPISRQVHRIDSQGPAVLIPDQPIQRQFRAPAVQNLHVDLVELGLQTLR
jgi:hypothetical protein